MTREEASNILDDFDVNFEGHTAEEIAEAFDVAFKALSQDTCDDAISREDALKVASDECQEFRGIYGRIEDGIQKLPPVTPSRRKGHWIDIYGKNSKTVIACKCSKCGESPKHAIKSKYCPNCGIENADTILEAWRNEE